MSQYTLWCKYLLFAALFITPTFSYSSSLKDIGPINMDFNYSADSYELNKRDSNHLLPYCSDLENERNSLRDDYGISLDSVACLGPMKLHETKKQKNRSELALQLVAEFVSKNQISRIVERNPALISLVSFLKFCRPRGGTLSPDELTCRYIVEF